MSEKDRKKEIPSNEKEGSDKKKAETADELFPTRRRPITMRPRSVLQ